MQIVVSESSALQFLVSELLQDDDPDYPMTYASGLSITLERQVSRVLLSAMTDQTFFSDPRVAYYVDLIRNDPLISHLLQIPWRQFKVLDNQGTILFAL